METQILDWFAYFFYIIEFSWPKKTKKKTQQYYAKIWDKETNIRFVCRFIFFSKILSFLRLDDKLFIYIKKENNNVMLKFGT